MGVYVDNARIPHKRGTWRLLMSHMLADTTAELESMARALDLKPGWIQYSGTYREHYDIGAGKRAQALRLGALGVDSKFLVQLRRRKRTGEPNDVV